MSDAPELVGRYRIVRPLGRGRLGELYLASDTPLGRQVAVRVLPPLSEGEARRAPLTVKSFARLDDPSVATIFDFGEHQGRLFYVREYVLGQTLSVIIKEKTDVPLRRRLEWMAAVCKALVHAHQIGLFGLVPEPSDIVIDKAGKARIVDFGLALLFEDPGAVRSSYYLAPETIAGRSPGWSSDIFAAGALLYELITYEEPFGGGARAEVRQRIAEGAEWRRPHDLEPALAAIVTRALQFEPASRYRDLEELSSELGRVLAQDDFREVPGADPSPAAPAPAAPARPDSEEVKRRLNELLVVANAAFGARVFEKALSSAEHALLIDPTSKLALAIVDKAKAALEARHEQELRKRTELESVSERSRPVDLATTRRVDDNVRFTVYRPPAIAPQHWYDLLFFTHLGERRHDAPADEPDPIARVEAMARSILGPAVSSFPRNVQDAGAGIPHEALLRIVPSVPGLTFNPPEYSFLWTEPVHQAAFRVWADATFEGQTVRGTIDVRMGAISVALITVAIPVDASAVEEKPSLPEVFQPYRRIFASYSHEDTAIVQQFENYARGMGDSYMRDVIHLRAGELWDDRLLEMIDEADVFQLFWSSHSIGSPFVRREWEHALTIAKSNFVRPLYWESPLPERDGLPPPELKARHFASVAVADAPDADEIRRKAEDERRREEIDLREARARQQAEEAARYARMEVERRQQMEEQRAREEEQHREHQRARAEAEARRREDEERQAADQAMIGESDQAVLSQRRVPAVVIERTELVFPPSMGAPPAPMTTPPRPQSRSRRLPAVLIAGVLALVALALAFLVTQC